MPILTVEERLGTKLAEKYRLDHILGRGGFGVVYAGVHEWTGRPVAAKVLNHELGQQQAFVKRFLQEARSAARLNHPNVVDVLDMGQDADGTVYLVLEYLEGEDLSSLLKKRTVLSVHEALEILMPVMDALTKAHRKGIVHRDLKPDNIFLSRDGKGRLVPKLLDFGIAKDADSGGTATHTGMVIGTPHYMAPEQARGLSDIGPSADVWSMGVVLWQCLSAQVPFDAGTPTGVLAEILTRRAPSFAQVVPSLAGPLTHVIDRALQHEREHRYPDMGAFLQAVSEATAGLGLPRLEPMRADPSGQVNLPQVTTQAHQATPHPSQPTPMSWSGTSEPEPKERNVLVIGAAGALALLLAGGVVGAITLWPSAAEPEAAPPHAASSTPAPAPIVTAPAPSLPPEPSAGLPQPETTEPLRAPEPPPAFERTEAEPMVAAPEAPSTGADAAEQELRQAEASRTARREVREAPREPSTRRISRPVPEMRPLHTGPSQPAAPLRVGTNNAPILR